MTPEVSIDAVEASLSAVQVRFTLVAGSAEYPSLQVATQVSSVFFPVQVPIPPFVGTVGSSHVAAQYPKMS